MLGSRISNSLDNDNFAVLFIDLELRREHTEDYMKVGESQREAILWSHCRIVNKIMCSLEGGYPLRGLKERITLAFPRCVNLHAQEQWTGFDCRRYRPGACLPTVTCSVRHLWSDRPVSLLLVIGLVRLMAEPLFCSQCKHRHTHIQTANSGRSSCRNLAGFLLGETPVFALKAFT